MCDWNNGVADRKYEHTLGTAAYIMEIAVYMIGLSMCEKRSAAHVIITVMRVMGVVVHMTQ